MWFEYAYVLQGRGRCLHNPSQHQTFTATVPTTAAAAGRVSVVTPNHHAYYPSRRHMCMTEPSIHAGQVPSGGVHFPPPRGTFTILSFFVIIFLLPEISINSYPFLSCYF